MAHSGYNYCNAADWHIAWLSQILRCISSKQRKDCLGLSIQTMGSRGYFLIHWEDLLKHTDMMFCGQHGKNLIGLVGDGGENRTIWICIKWFTYWIHNMLVC